MKLSTPVKNLSGIGEVYQEKLKNLNIKTVGDLLYHFPHRYEDFSNVTSISKIKPGEECSVQGTIKQINNTKTYQGKNLTHAIIEDDSGAVKVVWFNQPYLTNVLESGQEVSLAGQVKIREEEIFISNPAYEKMDQELTHTGRIVPVYPETEGLSSHWLRKIIKPLVEEFKDKIPETLPEQILKQRDLLPVNKALKQIHFPSSLKKAEQAKHRFSFEELFLIELLVLRQRQRLNQRKSYQIPFKESRIKQFADSLPFELTDAQRKAAWEVLQDLQKEQPMNRLLEGDVGSGKTIVAAIAALNTAKNNYQTAIMAPTSVLAKQHFKSFSKLLADFKQNIGFLTGDKDKWVSRKLKRQTIEISREKLLEKVEDGQIDILIGTHALIQGSQGKPGGVDFSKLGLVILDEQHRFGVEQRAQLTQGQEQVPHLLSMTATPIPRTLALTIYGDLDLSVIDELPPGRKKVATELINSKEGRQKTYQFIRKEVDQGRQAFVICPRIEPGDEDNNWSDVKSVEEEYEKLNEEVFPDLKVGKLHGDMKNSKKERIMKKFKKGKLDIIISTSVVEVGVDVPNATVMMIEGAERFGLAQLHQFRGRVGRAEHKSYCFLFTTSESDKTKKRLKALVESEDGFDLAERDLKLRGPGDLSGTRQWGIPDLAMGALTNVDLVKKARKDAQSVLEQDPELKDHPRLEKRVESIDRKVHLE
ncbi:MAG: ATP-dependent DNA helicase RecG [Candidatus Paceibacterota bacterium]